MPEPPLTRRLSSLTTSVVVGILLSVVAMALLDEPSHPRQVIGLAFNGYSPRAMLCLIAPPLLAAALGAQLAGTRAGVLAAAVALLALSAGSGTLRDALLVHGPVVHLWALLDLGALIVVLTVAALLARSIGRQPLDSPATVEPPLGGDALATVGNTLAALIGVWVLTPVADKRQTLPAVLLATTLAAAVTKTLLHPRRSIWLWPTPFVLGAIAYSVEWLAPGAWEVGAFNLAIARPAPLDYAGAGLTGTLLGITLASLWTDEEASEPDAVETV